MEAEEIGRLIGELEIRVERLRALYEQYFMGIERLEPLTVRKDIDRRLWALRREQIRNTGLRFKLETTIQRYNTYQQYWQRIVREIEAGTYQRDLGRAAQRFGENAVTGFAKRRQKMFEKGLSKKAERDALRRTGAGASQKPPADAEEEAPPSSNETYDVTFEDDAAAPAVARGPVETPEPHVPLELEISEPAPPPPPRREAPVAPAARAALPADPRKAPAPAPARAPVVASQKPAIGGTPPAYAQPPAPAASPAAASRAGPPPRAPLASSSGLGAPPPPPPRAPLASSSGANVGTAARPAVPMGAAAPKPGTPFSASATKPAALTPTAAKALPPFATTGAKPATPGPPAAKAATPIATPAKPGMTAAAASKPATPMATPTRPVVQPPAAPPPRPPAASRPDAPGPAVLSEDNSLSPIRMRQIYGAFVEAKRKANESTASVTYEKIASNLENVAKELRAKHKARSVDFEVVMKNGKPVLKPVVKG